MSWKIKLRRFPESLSKMQKENKTKQNIEETRREILR